MRGTSTVVRDNSTNSRRRAVRHLVFGLLGLLLVAGGLFAVQLVRRDIWLSDCVEAGGSVVRFTDDAAPFVAPGARTTYTCEGSEGTISTWR